VRQILGALGLLVASATAQSQGWGVIKGRVVDPATDRRISDASIVVAADMVQARTDSLGQFLVRVRRSGTNVLTVRRLGYDARSFAIEVPSNDTAEVQLPLERAATRLDTVTVRDAPIVSPRLDAFERRLRSKRGGWFVTRAEIDSQHPIETADLLRRAVGVEVVKKDLKTRILSKRGLVWNYRTMGAELCAMPIGVDGRVMEQEFDINTIPSADVHGIEVYFGPSSIPPEYLGSLPNNFCGLVMVWTRAS
jgi:CarboxypepD_reg-like domain